MKKLCVLCVLLFSFSLVSYAQLREVAYEDTYRGYSIKYDAWPPGVVRDGETICSFTESLGREPWIAEVDRNERLILLQSIDAGRASLVTSLLINLESCEVTEIRPPVMAGEKHLSVPFDWDGGFTLKGGGVVLSPDGKRLYANWVYRIEDSKTSRGTENYHKWELATGHELNDVHITKEKKSPQRVYSSGWLTQIYELQDGKIIRVRDTDNPIYQKVYADFFINDEYIIRTGKIMLLLHLPSGEAWEFEVKGEPLQYIHPYFTVYDAWDEAYVINIETKELVERLPKPNDVRGYPHLVIERGGIPKIIYREEKPEMNPPKHHRPTHPDQGAPGREKDKKEKKNEGAVSGQQAGESQPKQGPAARD